LLKRCDLHKYSVIHSVAGACSRAISMWWGASSLSSLGIGRICMNGEELTSNIIRQSNNGCCCWACTAAHSRYHLQIITYMLSIIPRIVTHAVEKASSNSQRIKYHVTLTEDYIFISCHIMSPWWQVSYQLINLFTRRSYHNTGSHPEASRSLLGEFSEIISGRSGTWGGFPPLLSLHQYSTTAIWLARQPWPDSTLSNTRSFSCGIISDSALGGVWRECTPKSVVLFIYCLLDSTAQQISNYISWKQVVIAYTEATGTSPIDRNPPCFPPAVTVCRNMDVGDHSPPPISFRLWPWYASPPTVTSLFRQTTHFHLQQSKSLPSQKYRY
jgi:hypothetical protein